jgi:hypothetical protein
VYGEFGSNGSVIAHCYLRITGIRMLNNFAEGTSSVKNPISPSRSSSVHTNKGQPKVLFFAFEQKTLLLIEAQLVSTGASTITI